LSKRTSKYNINSKIKSSEVRLIDENGNQKGIVSIEKALDLAYDAGLDLIEISPNAKPPVCKILDFGKFKYEIEKQYKINKKKQHVIQVKEIRLRPNTDDHDLLTKLNKGQKFLENGDKLKVTLMFRGREFYNRREAGKEILDRIVEILKDISVVDKPADWQGQRISIILSPK
tara:strand:+ start:107 stop:625 length:519 start_codon:yes stop_codon:yes gene_type:complete